MKIISIILVIFIFSTSSIFAKESNYNLDFYNIKKEISFEEDIKNINSIRDTFRSRAKSKEKVLRFFLSTILKQNSPAAVFFKRIGKRINQFTHVSFSLFRGELEKLKFKKNKFKDIDLTYNNKDVSRKQTSIFDLDFKLKANFDREIGVGIYWDKLFNLDKKFKLSYEIMVPIDSSRVVEQVIYLEFKLLSF